MIKEPWLSDASLQAGDLDWNVMRFLSNQIKAVNKICGSLWLHQ